jgi:hypothetical protein
VIDPKALPCALAADWLADHRVERLTEAARAATKVAGR